MLRASGKHSGDDYDLTATIGDSEDGGVDDGAVLIEFGEAVLDTDEARLAAARAAVIAAVGEAGFVDAAAIISTFDGIDRVADSTGMPLSDEILERSADFREQLGLNDYLSAGVS
jgi:hypothetical protein